MNDLYLDSDGTLGISADVDISKVKRILLTQEGTHYGSMYYLDDSDHSADVSKMVNGGVVSRREATQTILEFIVEYLGGAFDENLQKKLIERINALSFAEPEQRWIPCSERLPFAEYGEADNVLCTCKYKDVDPTYRRIKMLYFNGGVWCYPTGETFEGNVIAWMPLPEPYGGDNE